MDARGKISEKYYDRAGREIRVVDPLGNTLETVYDSRGNKIAEIDGEGDASYTEYDLIGNKLAEYDPRGVIPQDDNPEGYTGEIVNLNGKAYILVDKYRTAYQYDRLARKVRTTYPVLDGEKIAHDEIIHYDSVCNKTKVINGEKEVNYRYYDTYWLKAEQVVTADGIRTTTYGYDKAGNKRYVTEAEGNPDNITNFSNDNYPFINNDYTTEYIYDDLYRIKEEIKSDGSRTEFHFDEVGNKILEKDAEGNITEYRYNPYDKLTEVYEAGIAKPTEYQYDPNGNMVKKVMSNNLVTSYQYNNINQLIKETKPGNEITTYSYDNTGNLEMKINPRGIKEGYSYYKNGLLDKINYYQNKGDTEPAETINYQYDRAGNRLLVAKEESSIFQSYDALGRVIAESRTIADKSYTTKYRYDKYGNLTGIKYPESDDYLAYGYDDLNQLKWIAGIVGDEDNPAFAYNKNGQLTEMLYDNGVKTSYGYNELGRPESIVTNRTDLTTNISKDILDLNYQYDKVGNVKVRNNNNYDYDGLNRLERAEVEGDFYLENQGTNGRALEDYLGEESLTFTPEAWEYECNFGKKVAFDFNSGSIGVAFEQEIRNITRLELKTLGIADHRVSKRSLEVYYSDNNVEYTKLAAEDWEYARDYKGDITLTIPQGINARYIKVHSKFIDWDGDFEVIDESQFINGLEHMIKVYSRDDGATINYEYDSVGNRTKKVLRTLSGNMKEYEYHYYQGTNRLRDYTINGKNTYAYVYDEAGNLVKKGNKYSIAGDTVTFTETEGQGVEYYEYEYNLQNRLSKVKKNGEIIAEFVYDADGMRIKAEEQLIEEETSKTTYYVYGYSGKVLMEESSSSGSKYTSYIYAFAKTFAKVDGVVDPTTIATAEISYFHYDNLGSTRLMTDREGKITFDQDYLPFGGDLPRVGQVEVQNGSGEGYKYTGQKEVVSIGLYYYGARYYDPEIGRFITEDSYVGEIVNPQSQNLYVYVMNNPLRYIDPSGNSVEEGLDYEPDIILSYNDTELVFSFELAWDNLKYDPNFIRELMIEIPYTDVSMPTLLETLPEFITKESINYGTGKMFGPVMDDISNRVGNELLGNTINKSIEFYSGEAMKQLINGLSSSERKREFLTNNAIAVWNTILKGVNEDNARILNVWKDEDIKKGGFWNTTMHNNLLTFSEFLQAQGAGAATTLLVGDPNSGYLLNSAANFYDKYYPVKYKEGDIVRAYNISYITKKDFHEVGAFRPRLMTLHQVMRDDKIYQSYLQFQTLPIFLNEHSRSGISTYVEPNEKYHGAIF